MSDETPATPPPTITTTSQHHSPTIGKIALALATAQGLIKTAEKNENNPHFGKSYADLADVWSACRGPLSTNGLAVVQLPGNAQPPGNGQREVTVTTYLVHGESGEYFCTTLGAVPQKTDPQGVGSTITYLRRYSLAAVVGVAPKDDDDDGNAGSGKGPPPRTPPAAGSTSGKAPSRPPVQAPAQGSGAPAAHQSAAAEVEMPPTVAPFAKRFDECVTEEDFRKVLASTRETFTDGTPEKKAYNHVVKVAAKRIGVQPKGAAS